MTESNNDNEMRQPDNRDSTPISDEPAQYKDRGTSCERSDFKGFTYSLSDFEEHYGVYRSLSPTERYDYRHASLGRNNVHIVGPSELMPPHLKPLVNHVFQPVEHPSSPSVEEVLEDPELAELRGRLIHKFDMMRIFIEKIANDEAGNYVGVKCSKQMPIFRRHLPSDPESARGRRISQPVPDLLFGYSDELFQTPEHRYYFDPTRICNAAANEDNVILPFLTVQVIGQWPTNTRSFYGMENEAAAASTACVNMMEYINVCMKESPRSEIFDGMKLNSVAFSVVTNGSEARLFMTWREDGGEYKMRYMQSWVLTEEDQYLEFRTTIRNVLLWGNNERFLELKTVLNALGGTLRLAEKEATANAPEDGTAEARERPSKRAKPDGEE